MFLFLYFIVVVVVVVEPKEDLVVEDIFIPGPTENPKMFSHQLLPSTVEGKQPLRKHYLQVRRVPRNRAIQIVVDIAIYEDVHSIPENYTKLWLVVT